jgi:hypothetical protein
MNRAHHTHHKLAEVAFTVLKTLRAPVEREPFPVKRKKMRHAAVGKEVDGTGGVNRGGVCLGSAESVRAGRSRTQDTAIRIGSQRC